MKNDSLKVLSQKLKIVRYSLIVNTIARESQSSKFDLCRQSITYLVT